MWGKVKDFVSLGSMKLRCVSVGFLVAMPGRLGSQELQMGMLLALCG